MGFFDVPGYFNDGRVGASFWNIVDAGLGQFEIDALNERGNHCRRGEHLLWRRQTARVAIIELVVRMVSDSVLVPRNSSFTQFSRRMPMRTRTAWLGVAVMIGPLMGSVAAKSIAIGEVVPNLEFKDIRYLRRTLTDLGTHQGLALVFLSTDCPVSKRFLPKLRELSATYGQKDIQFVGVFCSTQDTGREIASFMCFEKHIRFPVVKDEVVRVVPRGWGLIASRKSRSSIARNGWRIAVGSTINTGSAARKQAAPPRKTSRQRSTSCWPKSRSQ